MTLTSVVVLCGLPSISKHKHNTENVWPKKRILFLALCEIVAHEFIDMVVMRRVKSGLKFDLFAINYPSSDRAGTQSSTG